MVIFHSYVNLPEGTLIFPFFPIYPGLFWPFPLSDLLTRMVWAALHPRP